MSESALASPLPSFHQALDDFEKEYADLERLVDSLFSQLERANQEVSRKAGELARERQLAEDRERRLAERERELAQQREENARLLEKFEQQEARLADAIGALEEIKARFTQQAAHQREISQCLSGEGADVAVVFEERDSLRGQLDAAHDEVARLAHLAAELAEARAELLRFQQQGASAGDGEGNTAISALQQERSALESELELVRSRAAELQASVEDHKRRMAEQQAEFSQELRRLREALERQTETLAVQTASRPASEIAAATAAPAAGAPASAAPADPVVSSVMAQFAKIQKDVQRRKART